MYSGDMLGRPCIVWDACDVGRCMRKLGAACPPDEKKNACRREMRASREHAPNHVPHSPDLSARRANALEPRRRCRCLAPLAVHWRGWRCPGAAVSALTLLPVPWRCQPCPGTASCDLELPAVLSSAPPLLSAQIAHPPYHMGPPRPNKVNSRRQDGIPTESGSQLDHVTIRIATSLHLGVFSLSRSRSRLDLASWPTRISRLDLDLDLVLISRRYTSTAISAAARTHA